MEKTDFTQSFFVPQAPEEVFATLLNIPAWWSGIYEETITGKSEQLNDEFTFLAGGGVHYSKHRLSTMEPNKRLAWQVTESKLTFLEEPNEWAGTTLCFDLAPEENGTRLTFTHEGLVPEIECYEGCSSAWTLYMQQLKAKLNLIEENK